ncbi:hypothetical protein D3C80_679340 [compost metagenome]
MQVDFPGVPHGAVGLDGVLRRKHGRFRRCQFGVGDEYVLICLLLCDRIGGAIQWAFSELDLHRDVSHQMLDRLERPHRFAELLALEGVVHRQVDHALGQPEQLRGTGEGATVEGSGPQTSALFTAGNTGARCWRPLDLEQLTARVDRLVAGQAHGITLQRMHFIAMGQQQQIGDMGIADQRVARLGNRETCTALGHSRQPFLFERGVLLIQGGEQRHADQHGVHQRLRQTGVTAFLGNQHEVQLIHAHAVLCLGHGQGGQAQFHQLRPELLTAPAVALPQFANAFRGDFVDQEAADVVLKQQLVAAETKVHGLFLRHAACRACVRQ